MNLLNRDNDLLKMRHLNVEAMHCESGEIHADIELFKKQIIDKINLGQSKLPIQPGFEKHPYKGILKNKQTSKYIIGTFPPVSYIIDNIHNEGHEISQIKQPTPPYQNIERPKIPFFHGNVNALWSVLLTAAETNELKRITMISRYGARDYLINKLNDFGIYYDDIILYVQRNLGSLGKPNYNLGYTYEDKNLRNICPDFSLVQEVLTNRQPLVICFTNGVTFRSGENGGLKIYSQKNRYGFVQTENVDALSLFLRTCQEVGLEIEMRCLPYFNWTVLHQLTAEQKRTKLIYDLRFRKTKNIELPGITEFQQKEITVITPFSPAAHGTIENHPIILALRKVYGGNLSAAQLLPYIYNHLRSDSYQELYQFNINR